MFSKEGRDRGRHAIGKGLAFNLLLEFFGADGDFLHISLAF